MSLNLRTRHPSLFAFASAVFAVLFIWGLKYLGYYQGDVIWRMCFAAAFVLISFDLIESHYINPGPGTWRNPHRWMYGFYAAFMTFGFVIILYAGAGALNFGGNSALIIALGGAVGAVIGTMLGGHIGRVTPLPERFQLDQDFSQSKPYLYYGWPVFIVLALGGFVWLGALNDPEPRLFFVQLMVMATLGPRYQAKRTLPVMLPRIAAMVLFTVGFFLR